MAWSEKLTKLLLNLKNRSVKGLVRKLEVNGKENCDQAKINDNIKILFEKAFKCHKCRLFTNCSNILSFTCLVWPTNKKISVKLSSGRKNYSMLWNLCLIKKPLAEKLIKQRAWWNILQRIKRSLFKIIWLH